MVFNGSWTLTSGYWLVANKPILPGTHWKGGGYIAMIPTLQLHPHYISIYITINSHLYCLLLLLLLLVPYDLPYHGPGLRRTSVHPGWSVAVHADRFGGLQEPIGAGAGGQGWPGTARDGRDGDVVRSVETMGWFDGKHSPNKGGKAKGCHWLLVGFDGSIFFGGCHNIWCRVWCM